MTEQMTIEQKRVMVARDALAQVKSGMFSPGLCYFRRNRDNTCQGCAIGALFLGQIIRRPSLQHSRASYSLRELWSIAEQDIIENCYESDLCFNLTERRWRAHHKRERDRLIAILQNIIRNNGTFIPTDIQPLEADPMPSLDFHHLHRQESNQPLREPERVDAI